MYTVHGQLQLKYLDNNLGNAFDFVYLVVCLWNFNLEYIYRLTVYEPSLLCLFGQVLGLFRVHKEN